MILPSIGLTAPPPIVHRERVVAPVFQGFNATFLLKEVGRDGTLCLNPKLAVRRVAPWSTFKIVNSLIGLEVGAVTDESTLFLWDGRIDSREVANHDHTLESAFKNSIVWYYQEVARRIGPERMQTALDRIPFGNHDISGGIDRFWLGSSLRVSPAEQLGFVERLYRDDLPFSPRSMHIVRKLMIKDVAPGWSYAGKTGSSGDLGGGRGHGWFVGGLTYHAHRYVFATFIEGQNASGPKANELTRQALAVLGFHP